MGEKDSWLPDDGLVRQIEADHQASAGGDSGGHKFTARKRAHRAPPVSGGAVDCFANSFIGSAATKITVHRLRDLLVGRIGRLCQQCGGGHDLSRLAIAALRNFFRDPGLLQHVQAVGSEAFNRRHALARDLRNRSRAGANRIAVDVDGAGAAQSRAAAEFSSGELESVAENPE